jgi:hypothetical protein
VSDTAGTPASSRHNLTPQSGEGCPPQREAQRWPFFLVAESACYRAPSAAHYGACQLNRETPKHLLKERVL